MEKLSNIKLFTISVTLFEFIGEAKHHTSLRLLCFRIISCCIMGLTLFFIFCNFLAINEEGYVKTLQSLSFIFHILLKYLLLIKYKNSIEKLLQDIEKQFWNYRTFGEDIVQAIERNYKIVRRMQTVTLFLSTVIVYVFLLRSLFISNSALFFESLIPNTAAMDAILLLCHYFCVYFAYIVVLGFDLIYFSLCVHVVIQLVLLKKKMENAVNDYTKVNRSEISSCIGHHQFLFSVFLRMKYIYSAVLFFHYFITLITICSTLCEMLTGYTDLTNYIAQSLSILFLFCQFACYTIPAEQVAHEFSDIADTVYLSHWYMNNISTQRVLLYVMLNSQRAHYFSGIGLIDINVDAFVSVVRKSFSFYALIKNLLIK